MTDFKINGLVIGERELGDNDKLLTILSERYGKVVAIGKGVKSIKNRNMCCCQPFTYASFNLRKRGKYYFITESDLIENFFDIRNDILKLSLASYLCELINQVAANNAMRMNTAVINQVLNEAIALVQPPTDKGKR